MRRASSDAGESRHDRCAAGEVAASLNSGSGMENIFGSTSSTDAIRRTRSGVDSASPSAASHRAYRRLVAVEQPNDGMHQITDIQEIATVLDRTDRQRCTAAHGVQQHQKISLHARTVDQRQADDDSGGARSRTCDNQRALGIGLAAGIRILCIKRSSARNGRPGRVVSP